MTYNVFSGTLNPTHFTSLRFHGSSSLGFAFAFYYKFVSDFLFFFVILVHFIPLNDLGMLMLSEHYFEKCPITAHVYWH